MCGRLARSDGNAHLQPLWSGIKDALATGGITTAAAFTHSHTREQYQDMWNQLPSTILANVGDIMTSIQLVEVGPGGAQYEMLRDKDGRTYSVWFQLDDDGLWRLLRF